METLPLRPRSNVIRRRAGAIALATLFVSAPAPAFQGDCSQPVTTGEAPGAADCLFLLQAAVGARNCEPACLCAPRGTMPAVAADALACLRSVVGEDIVLDCPCGKFFGDLGAPLPTAGEARLASFERGRDVAMLRFEPETGLGPHFNVVSCANCHEKPVLGGGAARYRDFLLVRRILPDNTSSNTGVNGVQPNYTLEPAVRRPTDSVTNLEAARNPIPFFGVGLLAELPESQILANVDEFDENGDGISGCANYDRGFVGRFGRKAQTVSIEGFIRGPLFNHLGITTEPLSNELKALLPVPSAILNDEVSARRGGDAVVDARDRALVLRIVAFLSETLVGEAEAQAAADETPNFDTDGAPDPELSQAELFDLVSFSMLLAAPKPDDPTPRTLAGKARFHEVGCTGCHVPSLDGPRGPVPAYSDLLLHDMGESLADGIVMGFATGSEFRTQPLWGIAAVSPYLHDGRADTLDEAIRWHGGEAQASRDSYVALAPAEQEEILAFLESLGGAMQRSAGLLPPGTPMRAVGEIGGPVSALSPGEEALFLAGRDLFDRDLPLSGGLGPRFNGDSCRACHFDPLIGGSGPDDVNVIRHGTFDNGEFMPPASGTIAPRFSTDGTRPAVDPSANVFEARQTPALFGLGFLESISDDAILANANCEDPDPGAISGCPHFLATGELGRFGWKANVPNLTEFARDALSNETGMTIPEVPGLTFGLTSDDDEVPDPEIGEEDLAALIFFMQQLAPPPGQSSDPGSEAAGRDLFDAAGCVACHVADFVTDQGVVAYTDLLLHAVAPEGKHGIPEGSATAEEFRTPPLWGLSVTGPYMHDGRAFSIEAAILRHDGEAAASRDAYEALSGQEKEMVLAFLASL
jgi:CxxC motif-containing protein (DUF1111 family)